MSQAKKIIFVVGVLGAGGAERVISILASGCAELGAEVTLVTLWGRENTYPVSDKVNYIPLKPQGKFEALQRIRQLRRVLKESDAETVVPFLPIVSLYTIAANIGVGKRLILSERADPYGSIHRLRGDKKTWLSTVLVQYLGLHKLADWTVFQTPDARSWYSKRVQARSCIIPNPLDTSTLPERYQGQREKRIVAAGRFSESKNFPMLIEGFARFHLTHPEYTLTLYGAGKLQPDYEQLAESLGIRGCVEMPGFSTNLHSEIHKAGMYISTSNHEGISNSMLEALGMGIPTIVTDCPVGGARMFVHTDVNGILIPMNDVDALVNAMNRIADDAAYAERISLEAVKIREELNREQICRQWMELF